MSVITIDRAKLYLRIDDALDADQEAELQSMINAAEIFVGRKTGYIFEAVNKTYYKEADGCIRVYDYPINTDLSSFNHTIKQGYTLIQNEESVDLNVGYATPTDVPDDLINAALQMLKVWYYESEKQQNSTLMPENVKNVLWNRKRFIV